MQQLQYDIASLPGLIVGTVMVLIALAMFGILNRVRISNRLNKIGLAALVIGTIGLCAFGYLGELLR